MKSKKINGIKSAREASLLALLAWIKDDVYLADSFQKIRTSQSLDTVDMQLAQEIAFGVVRRFWTLEAIIKKFLAQSRMKLKQEAKLILKMAVYQLVFMDKVPVYAVVFESVELSKKHSPYQAGFINGILRKLTALLPLKELKKDLALEEYYSVPLEYIEKLQTSYPEKYEELLEATISRPKMTFLELVKKEIEKEAVYLHEGKHFNYCALKKDETSLKLLTSKGAYVQNPTPGILIEELVGNETYEKILDLCSAPGGKLVLLNRIFPKAKFYANEISKERISRLKENLKKYQIDATIWNEDGTKLDTEEKFDLVVIDAPCSNSGVLNKKPEAKFRLQKQNLEDLKKTQADLINSAVHILTPQGKIIYLTCSILPEENLELISNVLSQNKNLKLVKSLTVLPDLKYLDGGFGASLEIK